MTTFGILSRDVSYLLKTGKQTRVTAMMLDLIPKHPQLQLRIISTCESEGHVDNVIAAWYELVDRNPESRNWKYHFSSADSIADVGLINHPKRVQAAWTIKQLGYLLLGIEQAAAYVREVAGDIATFLDDHEKES